MELLTAASRGENRAVEELLRRHGGRLHACAWRMLGDADTAVETVASWHYTTTLNHCRDHLRRSATRMFRDSAPLHETHPDLAPGPHDRIERSDRNRLVRETVASRLHRALQRLGEILRAAGFTREAL